jgi:hypothetical protein
MIVSARERLAESESVVGNSADPAVRFMRKNLNPIFASYFFVILHFQVMVAGE